MREQSNSYKDNLWADSDRQTAMNLIPPHVQFLFIYVLIQTPFVPSNILFYSNFLTLEIDKRVCITP